MKRISLSLILAGLLVVGCEVKWNDQPLLGQNTTGTADSTALANSGDPSSDSFFDALEREYGSDARDLPASNMYEIHTDFGVMLVRLYDETPRHRDNFKRLVAEEFYDGTTFHRVMENFMIQGGDPNSRDGDRSNDGLGGPGYTQPAEIRVKHHHKRGALAAARKPDQANPKRASSGSQFYIVHGREYEENELRALEVSMKKRVSTGAFTFTDEAVRDYTTLGGTPFLDRQYTVFGELVGGFDVLDKIATLETDQRNNPLRSVSMTIKPAVAQ